MSYPQSNTSHPQLSICVFLDSDDLAQLIQKQLSHDRHGVTLIQSREEFCTVIEHEKQQIDCLILQNSPSLPHLLNWLHTQAILLPVVIVSELDRKASGQSTEQLLNLDYAASVSVAPLEQAVVYHTSEVWISVAQINQIISYIDRAIAQFLNLSPACRLDNSPLDLTTDLTAQNFLMLQQRRLSEKLKERLGYLGVYYKRNPQNFLRNLSPDQRQELLDGLKADYRTIVLQYFAADETLNDRIDSFVNTVFFTDIAVSQVVEIHMDLMDEFSKQLKLEGRNEDVLLDYRLTLIDTIAHLCEMYRRSIPREA